MIKIKTIIHYGGVCPFQLDALTNDDRMIYGRYRHGWIEVRIGAKDDASEDAAVSGESIFREKIGENFDGYIDIEQFKLETEDLIDWSEAFDQHALEREALLNKLRSK